MPPQEKSDEEELIDEAESIAAAAWGEEFELNAEDRQILKDVFATGKRRSYHLEIEKLLGLKEAIFLGQLRWLLKNNEKKNQQRIIKDHRGRWPAIYNSYEQWHEMLPSFSEMTLRRIVGRLEHLQIVFSKQGPWQKWYGINFKALAYFLQHSEELAKFERRRKK